MEFLSLFLFSLYSHFPKELLVADGEDRDFAASASPEWFACFQTFFFQVNSQAGRMCVSLSADGTPIVVTASPAPGGRVDVGARRGAVSGTDTAASVGDVGGATVAGGEGAAATKGERGSGDDPSEGMIAGAVGVGRGCGRVVYVGEIQVSILDCV